MTDEAIEPLLTPGDLELILQLHRRTLMRMCKKGLFPRPIKLGGKNPWRREDIATALNELNSKRKKGSETKRGKTNV
jgi:predicted DNA-binding transcriptional regulator AlpA